MNLLNLQKNETLDLTKKEPGLNKIVLACGWDVSKKGLFSFGSYDVDLDLSAFLLNKDYKFIGKDGFIYFNNQRGDGIYLHNDNRTGSGSGDDEKISIVLNELPIECETIIFCVSIYEAKKRKQDFSKVNNAYVRVLNEDKGFVEMCRYNLTEDGKNNTSLLFAQLQRKDNEWVFKALGNLLSEELNTVISRFR